MATNRIYFREAQCYFIKENGNFLQTGLSFCDWLEFGGLFARVGAKWNGRDIVARYTQCLSLEHIDVYVLFMSSL